MNHMMVNPDTTDRLRAIYATDTSSGSISMISFDLYTAIEKSELLLMMLHHQLRAIDVRTNDPTLARVDIRNVGSSRLSPSKMKLILDGIVRYFNHVYELFYSYSLFSLQIAGNLIQMSFSFVSC